MTILAAPLDVTAGWTFKPVGLTLPDGCRHAGRTLNAAHFNRASGGSASLVAPLRGVVTHVTSGSDTVIELTPLPFENRAAFQAVPSGLPTFYFLVAAAKGTAPFVADKAAELATADDVQFAIVGQNGVALDPAAMAAELGKALDPAGGGTSGWGAFAAALAKPQPVPVILLDHTGAPLGDVSVSITLTDGSSSGSYTVTLAKQHAGDLQKAVAAAGLPIGSVFAGGATKAKIALKPAAGMPIPKQHWTRWEDGATSLDFVELTPSARRASVTDLDAWFAPQEAKTQAGATVTPNPARYTFGNKIETFVDGLPTYADMIGELTKVRDSGGAVHFAGWGFQHDFDLVPKRKRKTYGLDEKRDLTLGGLITELSTAGRKSRFLVNRYLQTGNLSDARAIVAIALMAGYTPAMAFGFYGPEKLRMNMAGSLITLGAVIGGTWFMTKFVDNLGATLDDSDDAREALNALANTEAIWSLYPAEISDNPNKEHVLHQIAKFATIKRVGVYHQKLGVISHAGGNLVGYVGGVDFSPSRVDDSSHGIAAPFHDIHARIEGPAALDLARTFDQRWAHEAKTAPAFALPASQQSAGGAIAQVARTYFKTTDTSRKLPFATEGDFTLQSTLFQAIAAAREFIYIEDQYFSPSEDYEAALLKALDTIRFLTIVLPSTNDQPFSDLRQREVIAKLRNKAPTKVRIGNPMRRPSVAASAEHPTFGRLFLRSAMGPPQPSGAETIHLGPKDAIPDEVPFWLSVDGEMMLVGSPVGSGGTDGSLRSVYRDAHAGLGTTGAAHEKGQAATWMTLQGIYVHAKIMVVDDVFLGVGSANINRRGHYHDGELNVFAVPEELKWAKDNPARALRLATWADQLNLPPSVAGPLCADALAGNALFDRPYFAANRFLPTDAGKPEAAFDLVPGSSWFTLVLKALGFSITSFEQKWVFDTIIDPSTKGK